MSAVPMFWFVHSPSFDRFRLRLEDAALDPDEDGEISALESVLEDARSLGVLRGPGRIGVGTDDEGATVLVVRNGREYAVPAPSVPAGPDYPERVLAEVVVAVNSVLSPEGFDAWMGAITPGQQITVDAERVNEVLVHPDRAGLWARQSGPAGADVLRAALAGAAQDGLIELPEALASIEVDDGFERSEAGVSPVVFVTAVPAPGWGVHTEGAVPLDELLVDGGGSVPAPVQMLLGLIGWWSENGMSFHAWLPDAPRLD